MPRDIYPGLSRAILARYAEEGPKLLMEEFGCSENVVVMRARRRGIKSRNRVQRGHQTRRAQDPVLGRVLRAVESNYEEVGPRRLAEYLNQPAARLRAMAYRRHLKHRGRLPYYVYGDCNAYALKNPMTPQAAYFTGLIWARGEYPELNPDETPYLVIHMGGRNKSVLTDFAKFLGLRAANVMEREENYSEDPTSTERVYSIGIQNQVVNNVLEARGFDVLQGRGGQYYHPADIEDHVYHHFFRGWLDGHGKVTWNELTPEDIEPRIRTTGVRSPNPRIWIYGNPEIMREMRNRLSQMLGVTPVDVYTCEYGSGLTWELEEDVKRIFLWMHYEGADTYRKTRHQRALRWAKTGLGSISNISVSSGNHYTNNTTATIINTANANQWVDNTTALHVNWQEWEAGNGQPARVGVDTNEGEPEGGRELTTGENPPPGLTEEDLINADPPSIPVYNEEQESEPPLELEDRENYIQNRYGINTGNNEEESEPPRPGYNRPLPEDYVRVDRGETRTLAEATDEIHAEVDRGSLEEGYADIVQEMEIRRRAEGVEFAVRIPQEELRRAVTDEQVMEAMTEVVREVGNLNALRREVENLQEEQTVDEDLQIPEEGVPARLTRAFTHREHLHRHLSTRPLQYQQLLF